ncbi:MAG: menaquinone-dependent protoporphyrinogen IX dehydrogenase [Rubrivivax sp.]|nr:menaquinone-dependent protoporphyrinogen IX dehydrogenase [Rubrivivax sp.]
MGKVLFAYSSTDGHTRRICEHLRDALCAQGQAVELATMAEAGERDLAAYDKIVLGASIRYGRHKPEVAAFAKAHRVELQARPSAFFTVNIVARKPGKDRPETNPYLRKFLRRLPWQPRELDVFAGRLDYPRLGPLDRSIIRFIMWLTHGPTDPSAVVEFTDWQRVEAFGRRLAAM